MLRVLASVRLSRDPFNEGPLFTRNYPPQPRSSYTCPLPVYQAGRPGRFERPYRQTLLTADSHWRSAHESARPPASRLGTGHTRKMHARTANPAGGRRHFPIRSTTLSILHRRCTGRRIMRHPTGSIRRSCVILRHLLVTVSTTPEEGIRPRQSCTCVLPNLWPLTGSAPCSVRAEADAARQALASSMWSTNHRAEPGH